MLLGPETIENASRYKVDKMFFSTTAVSSTGIIAATQYTPMHKAIADHAAETFYLVDHKKIDLPFNTIYCDFKKVNYVISDYEFAKEVQVSYPSTNFILARK